jgi:hypothetical protein
VLLGDPEPFFGRIRALFPDTRGHGLSQKFARAADLTRRSPALARWPGHRPLVEAGRFEDYFDANVRLRLGEGELARLKARPERYAAAVNPLRQHTVKSLRAVLEETYTRSAWISECARIRIAGSEDHVPTLAMSRRIAATVPGARLAEFFAEIGFD